MITSSSRSPSTMMLFVLASLPAIAHGFLQSRISWKPPKPAAVVVVAESLPRRTTTSPRFMSPLSDDDDDDDDPIDPESLGDWRAFRMNLANSDGLPTASAVDGVDFEGSTDSSSSVASTASSVTSASAAPKSPARPKSVSKQNEKLLNMQNAALADEYLNGAWAHESAVPECGGLVCRMPLEAEIYRGDPESGMYRKLRALLESDEYDRTEGSIPTSLASSASTGGAASASVSSKGTMSRSREDSAGEDDADSPFSALAARTVFWYRGAEKLLKSELLKITSSASSNGRINPSDLDGDSMELLQLYMEHQQTWQEVCLVVDRDERTGAAKTLTINRPMAFKLSESLGRLVLFGAMQTDKGGGGAVNRKEGSGVETQNIVKFLGAFENECGVYIGGPEGMDLPAVMVHGIDDLPGAVEISPGTGIYRGGMEAACDGVLSGKYKALDFRFFIGHANYEGGELDEAVRMGKYQPVACSRPLVLKQCIQLPKPLWHEVLEFCGGELKEISKLEFTKRDDLQ